MHIDVCLKFQTEKNSHLMHCPSSHSNEVKDENVHIHSQEQALEDQKWKKFLWLYWRDNNFGEKKDTKKSAWPLASFVSA